MMIPPFRQHGKRYHLKFQFIWRNFDTIAEPRPGQAEPLSSERSPFLGAKNHGVQLKNYSLPDGINMDLGGSERRGFE
jgi:hypothetical protein